MFSTVPDTHSLPCKYMSQLGRTGRSVCVDIKVDDYQPTAFCHLPQTQSFLRNKGLFVHQSPDAFTHAMPLIPKRLKCMAFISPKQYIYFLVSCLSSPACLLEAAGWLSVMTVPICHLCRGPRHCLSRRPAGYAFELPGQWGLC